MQAALMVPCYVDMFYPRVGIATLELLERLGVAETGSILLSDIELQVNTIAFPAHDLVALLDPTQIVANIHDAYEDPHFKRRPYSVLMTGPSGSGDINGITVHPAQGVKTLTVVLSPDPHAGKRTG